MAGVATSEDGINWTNITDSLFSPIYGRIAIGINPANEDFSQQEHFKIPPTSNENINSNI